MPDQCPTCRAPLEAGNLKCPACCHELPPPSAPPPAGQAMVLAAALLPVLAVAVVFATLGGIVIAGVMFYRGGGNRHAAVPPPPSKRTPAPRIADQAIPLELPAAAPPPEAPVPQAVATPPPEPHDFDPAIAPVHSQLVLRGNYLSAVKKVLLISTYGGLASAEAKIISATDGQFLVQVPNPPYLAYPYVIAAFSPAGVAVMADQHTGKTPWGADGHLHNTVVNVRQGAEISTRSAMVVFAQPDSTISIGDGCTAFLSKGVTLKARGRHCHIYYVAPLLMDATVSRDGMLEVKSISIDFSKNALRVKLALPALER